MHEVHLMNQVVKAVAEALGKAEGTKPSLVRLKVSALSHLVSHDLSSLQSTFDLASLGTRVEGAMLDIVTVPVEARCRACGQVSNGAQFAFTCDACGSIEVDFPEIPEVVVQEVVVTE